MVLNSDNLLNFVSLENLNFDMKLIANKLSDSSRLVRHFVRSEEFATRFFPNNVGGNEHAMFDSILNRPRNLNAISEVCLSSMSDVTLNEKQQANLTNLLSGKSLTIVTGQQPGLFGGPIYSLTKAFSAYNYLQKFRHKYPDYEFVPIFWVADNDHDADEAGKTFIFDAGYDIQSLKVNYDLQNYTVANRIYDTDINLMIEQVAKSVENLQFSEEIIAILRNTYVPGASWSSAFIKFMNHFLCDCGFLFISAEKFREKGLFTEMAEKEISMPGNSAQVISQTNEELLSLGYHIQAQASDINLFYHKDNIRENIESINDVDRRNLFKVDTSLFSPKVLLRPLMQDYILPTAAYIAGPGELAYLAQLNKLYDYFDIIMPKILLRHSVTILDNRTLRFIDKHEINYEIFKSHQDEFMQILPKYLFDDETELAFLNSELKLKQIYDELSGYIVDIDKNLSKSLTVAYMKSLEQLTHIRKKATTSQKKSNEDFISRFMQIRNLILPNGKLQERIFCILNFSAIAGIDGLKYQFMNLPD